MRIEGLSFLLADQRNSFPDPKADGHAIAGGYAGRWARISGCSTGLPRVAIGRPGSRGRWLHQSYVSTILYGCSFQPLIYFVAYLGG